MNLTKSAEKKNVPRKKMKSTTSYIGYKMDAALPFPILISVSLIVRVTRHEIEKVLLPFSTSRKGQKTRRQDKGALLRHPNIELC